MPPASSDCLLAPIALDGVAIVAASLEFFDQHQPALPRSCHAIAENAQRAIGDARLHRMTGDLRHEHVGAEPQVFGRLYPAFFRNLLVLEKLSRRRLQRVTRQMRSELEHLALDVLQIQPVESAPEVLHQNLFAIGHANGVRQRLIRDIRTASRRPSPVPSPRDRRPRRQARPGLLPPPGIRDPAGNADATSRFRDLAGERRGSPGPAPASRPERREYLQQPGLSRN